MRPNRSIHAPTKAVIIGPSLRFSPRDVNAVICCAGKALDNIASICAGGVETRLKGRSTAVVGLDVSSTSIHGTRSVLGALVRICGRR